MREMIGEKVVGVFVAPDDGKEEADYRGHALMFPPHSPERSTP